MRRAGRAALLAALLAAALGGCRYSYRVVAERRGDLTILTTRDAAGRFAPHACVRRIAVVEAGRTIWEIENPATGWPHEGGQCARTDFPLVYGRAPPGFVTLVPAAELRADGDYVIVGEGVSLYHGRFRLSADLDVVNMRGRDARPGPLPALTSH